MQDTQVEQLSKPQTSNACITYATDARYLPLVVASLLTISATTSSKLDVAVFLIDVPSSTKSDLEAFFQGGNLAIQWIDLDFEKQFSGLGSLAKTLSRISLATYGRLVVNDILEGYRNHVYLDGDTLILADIAELTKQTPSIFCAINDDFYKREKRTALFERNGFKPTSGYFNAGVYILNTDYWRENDITRKCIETATNPDMYLPLADQDVLNLLFADKADWLDYRWNFKKEYSWTKPKEMPNLLHFAGRLRPWDLRDNRAPRSLRQFYANLFNSMPASVRKSVEDLQMPRKELRRSRKYLVRKWYDDRARIEGWKRAHGRTLAPRLDEISAELGLKK